MELAYHAMLVPRPDTHPLALVPEMGVLMCSRPSGDASKGCLLTPKNNSYSPQPPRYCNVGFSLVMNRNITEKD